MRTLWVCKAKNGLTFGPAYGANRCHPCANGMNAGTGSPSRVFVQWPTAGRFSHLAVNVRTNTLSGSLTVTVAIWRATSTGDPSPVTTACTISIPGGGGANFYVDDDGYHDSTATYQYLINCTISGTVSGSFGAETVSGQFEPASGVETMFTMYDWWPGTLTSTTRYAQLPGNLQGGQGRTGEAGAQSRVESAATIKGFRVQAGSNSHTTAVEVGVNVNGTSRLSVSVPAGASNAWYSDSDTYDVVAGDLLNYYTTLPADAGTYSSRIVMVGISSATGAIPIAGGSAADLSLTYSQVRYVSLAGDYIDDTEADTETYWADGGVVRKPSFYIVSNGLSGGGARVTLMVDGAASSLSFVASSGTGWKTDAGQITVAAGSRVAWRLDTTATSGDLVVAGIGAEFDFSPSKIPAKIRIAPVQFVG